MAFAGLRVFILDELFGADEGLRGQARTLREAADDLRVNVAGLPPEAQPVIAGLAVLRTRLDHAADQLTAAAADFGQTAADARRADSPRWLDYMKAFVAIASGEAPEIFLRHQGNRRVAKLRRDLRRHTDRWRELDKRWKAAVQAGDRDTARYLGMERDRRHALMDASAKELKRTREDVRLLREAGLIKRWDDRALRALKELAGAAGYHFGHGVLSAREWRKAVRDAGSLHKALGHRAHDRFESRRIPGGHSTPQIRGLNPGRADKADDLAARARRLFDNPIARRTGSAVPVAGAGFDIVGTGIAATKFWHDPTLGNGVSLLANTAHAVGNIPHPVTILGGEAVGYTLDGVKAIGDNVDEVDVTPWDGLLPG